MVTLLSKIDKKQAHTRSIRDRFEMLIILLLQTIHGILNKDYSSTHSPSPLALCGLGGIGKTQIAIEYTYRFYHEYEAVLWLKADTRENLLANFLSITSLLKLTEYEH